MIDLPISQIEAVKRILRKHVPNCEVRVFGSRVRGGAKPWSDLDLALVGDEVLEQHILYAVKEAFEESDLPIRVDVLDWHSISKEFQEVIHSFYEVLV
jgi:predicted nucleotidyltransferase